MAAASGSLACARRAAPGTTLLANTVWSLTGNGFYIACQWGFVVALAKLGSPALVGRYALAAALASPPMMLAGLQLRNLVATDVPPRFSFIVYRRVRVGATILALAAVAALGWLAGAGLQTFLNTFLIAVIKAAENSADLYYGVFQRHERMDTIAIAGSFRGALSLAGFVAALSASGSLAVALAAAALCQFAALLAVETRAVRPLLDWNAGSAPTAELTRLALPMGLVVALISLNAAVPRYFLGPRLGATVLGYFAALACLPLVLQAGVGAMAQASSSRLAILFQTDARAFSRLVLRLAGLAAAAGLVVVATTPWISAVLARLYHPDYAAQGALLVWLLIAGALAAVSGVLGTALTAARVIAPQPVLYSIAAAVCGLFCWLRVDSAHGAAGGAQALAASALVVLAGQALLLRRALAKTPEFPR